MNIKRILADNLFSAFLALCATALAESALLRLAGTSSPLAVGITDAVFTLAVVFIWLNRKNSAIYVGIAAIITIILSVLSLFKVSLTELPLKTAEHLLSGNELEAGEIMLITSVLSLFLAAILFPLMKVKALRYALGVLIVVLMIIYGVNGTVVDFVESFAAAGVIISVLSELSLDLLYKGEQKKKLNGVLSFLLPLFAAFSIAVAVIPSEEKPISWQLVKDATASVVNAFVNIADEIRLLLNPELSEFNLETQGYSDNSGFSAGLTESGATQLTLTGTTRLRSSVYLIGSVSDIYGSKGWSRSEYPYFCDNEYYLDYCEMICAMERADISNDDLKNFTERAGLRITYGDILTKTMFYPLKTVRVYASQGYDARKPTVLLDNKAENSSEYTLYFLNINYRSKEFHDLATTPYKYNGANIKKHSLDTDIPVDIENTLAERATYIQTAYTALPDTVTKRTHELADEITAPYTSNYEKLCAIEAYLKGYKYTLTPGGIPDGADAVDYFLFESKEGLCTYFASAMAVLARCEGIPTRYVQGFIADCASAETVRSCPISSSAAHAWAEAYIEGFGWIPFEPVESRDASRYGYADGTEWSASDNNEFNYPQAVINDEESTEEAAESDSSTFLVAIFFFTLLGIALTVVGYAALRVRAFVNAYAAASDTEKFMKCYKLTLLLLTKSRFIRGSGETAESFAVRVEAYNDDEDNKFGAITAVFGRIRYGGGSADNAEREQLELYLRQKFAAFSKKRGKVAALTVFVGFCFTK